jgi:periplasmic divalent cation tolerance protein
MGGADAGLERSSVPPAVQVLMTTATEVEAQTIAAALVDGHLAACVQVLGPVESWFWWEGRRQRTREWLCLAKTTADRYEALEAAVRERHSYDVPEIMAIPVVHGSERYLRWLADSVHPTS